LCAILVPGACRYLFGGGGSSDEDEAQKSGRGGTFSSFSSFVPDATASSSSASSSAAASSVSVHHGRKSAPNSVGEEEVWETWPEETTAGAAAGAAAGATDAYAILREGGEEAVEALVAAENWRAQFGEIIADVLGSDALAAAAAGFPWHVLAVRWLDGDTVRALFCNDCHASRDRFLLHPLRFHSFGLDLPRHAKDSQVATVRTVGRQ